MNPNPIAGIPQPIPVTPSDPAPIAGGGGTVGSYQQAFNTAFYNRLPDYLKAIYYGRPGVAIPAGAQPLTESQFAALFAQWQANPPVNPATGKTVYPVQQIDYWMWDPYTANFDAELQGVAWWPPAGGPMESAEVILPGTRTLASAPAACTLVSTTLADWIAQAWPASPTPAPSDTDPVGPQEFGNVYGVQGPVPAWPAGSPAPTYTDTRGTFTLSRVASPFPIATGSLSYVWLLTTAA
jgi:hypothetical protein